MKKTIINHVILLPMQGETDVIYDASLHVQGDKIVYAGPKALAPAAQDGDEVINGGGRIAMPGFVNTHAHNAMVLFRGAADDLPLQRWLNEKIFPMEDQLDDNAAYWGNLLGIAEMIRCGTACYNDMYFFTEQEIRAVEQTGIRSVLTRSTVCQELEQETIEQKLQVYDALMAYQGAADGRIRVTVSPHAEYTCSAAYLRACGQKAQQLGVPLHIHVSETAAEHDACIERHGKTPMALLESLGVLEGEVYAAHCVYTGQTDHEIMKEHGVVALHCPDSNLKLASGIAPVAQMMQRGVTVTLGTDGAASNNNLNMMEEMQRFVLLQKGITQDATSVSAKQALHIATTAGALAMHTGGGVLKEGYKADIVLVDTHVPHMQPMHNAINNLVYAAQGSDVWMNMVDGKILYQNGEYKTLDIEKVIAETNKAAEKWM
jgi:5-methylthioadenosine/S-adenosylhomocysteine deaminase